MPPSRQSIIEGVQPSQGWARLSGRAVLFFALRAALLSSALPSHAQGTTKIHIDASQPFAEPGPAHYELGSATTPSGRAIGVNSRYLTLDGKPWLPVMGEFHFSRYPQAQWEEEILKMKAGGVNIVAAYVIWIHHEEIEGQFDWEGQRDLRAFTRLCARHGMYVLARIGPWDHGEVRNGGFPDWVMKAGPTRINDPTYLAEVRTWFAQISEQLKGQLWKDGGPVIGIQLENEYSLRGPGAGEEHILTLKKMAIESGLNVPLWVETGWDNAAVPEGAVLPMYGGYPDAPWDGSLGKLAPQEVYAFRFQNRVSASLTATPAQVAAATSRPFFTTELGGGNQVTYHRRPVIEPDDIAAMFPVMLGAGVNLYGTYMFQGGENPDGKLSTLEESQATGYPNDVPVKSYDFQAPLSEFGEERASFRKLKVFQYFVNDFGAALAPMMVHAPNAQPKGPGDLSVPRASVRTNGDSGFIFMNNYVRGSAMPARPATQFEIQLPGGTMLVPRHPVDIPSGAYFIWPLHLRTDGVDLRYSTAQLFTCLRNAGVETYYFAAVRGIPVEFEFDAAGIRTVHASSGETGREAGAISIHGINPGVESAIDVVSQEGRTVRFVVLTPEEAENAWKVKIGGADHLLITAQDFFADTDGGRAWLESRGSPDFSFAISPAPASPPSASLPLTEAAGGKQGTRFTAQARPRSFELKSRQTQPAGIVPPVELGPAASWRPQGVAMAPADAAFAQAARWSLTVPPGAMDDLSELFLQVIYQGDVARLSADNKLLTDDFYNGHPWLVGLGRFLHSQAANTFDLSILPLRKDAPVYFELPLAINFPGAGQADQASQVDALDSLTLVPQYRLILDFSAGKAGAASRSGGTPAAAAKSSLH